MPRGVSNVGVKMSPSMLERVGLTRDEWIVARHTGQLFDILNGKAKFKAMSNVIPITPMTPPKVETDKEIDQRLRDQFNIIRMLVEATMKKTAMSVIISGPPGLGKSYTVEEALNKMDPTAQNFNVVKGYARATGLFELLYAHKDKGQVLVLDDIDSVFDDEKSLNLLKAACETKKVRTINWLAQTKFISESGSIIPNTFDFEGTIIFLTNIDFDAQVQRGHKYAKHIEALMSRAHYVKLELNTKQDFMVRIKQVETTLLEDFSVADRKAIINFVDEHKEEIRELSLRTIVKIGQLYRTYRANWDAIALMTCVKKR